MKVVYTATALGNLRTIAHYLAQLKRCEKYPQRYPEVDQVRSPVSSFGPAAICRYAEAGEAKL
jgi:hypothetical protein